MNTENHEITAMHTFEKGDAIFDFILKDGFCHGVKSSENYHFHSFFEIHYILRGHMHIVINDQDLFLSRGDLCLIPPKLVHYIYQDEDSHRVGFRFSFKQAKTGTESGCFARFDSAFGGLREARILPGGSLFRKCLDASREALSHAAPAYIVDELLFLALDELAYSIPGKRYPAEDAGSAVTDSLMAEYIEDYLNLHYRGTPQLGDLAQALKLSVRQLQRVIFRLFGMNFTALVTVKRLTVARFLLRKTDLSIEEIAYRVGFCDKPYFYRKFSAYYGITPLQYRKKRQNF